MSCQCQKPTQHGRFEKYILECSEIIHNFGHAFHVGNNGRISVVEGYTTILNELGNEIIETMLTTGMNVEVGAPTQGVITSFYCVECRWP